MHVPRVGSAYKSAEFAAFMSKRPELTHVRTRHYAPQTNGVVERFNQSLKYEHLYRHEIANGSELVELVNKYVEVYNTIRPHEELDFYTPSDAFEGRFIPNPKTVESVQDSGSPDTWHDVLVIDTASIVERYADRIRLTGMNTGATIFPNASPRGAESFMTIEDFPFSERRKPLVDNVVELCIIGGVDHVQDHVIRVERRRGAEIYEILHQR